MLGLVRPVRTGSAELCHPVPEQPGRTEFGDRDELVIGCGVTELELPAGDLGGEATLLERPFVRS